MNRFTTLGVMIKILAEERNFSLPAQRDKAVKLANKIRELFYNMYEDLPLFEDDGECFQVQCFPLSCNDCSDYYHGITLPDSMISAAGMWKDNSPIQMFSSWREYKTGFQPNDNCRLQSFQAIGNSPIECDIHPVGCATKFGVMADRAEDEGKKAVISYYDPGRQLITDTLTLCHDKVSCSSRNAIGFPDRGVRLPDDLVGSVSIFQVGGSGDRRLLSNYAPHQIAPSFKRYKVTGVSPGDWVYVRGARRFTPVFFDSDVVETDNTLAVENAARYLEHHASTSSDSILKAESYLVSAKAHLRGQKSREFNKTTVRKFSFSPYQPRRSRLRSKM